ncbi:type II secretion system protein [Botrimarina mediterranea]|uniref:Uncharacterized protein n=1 Tax=Botrimarina mediterranea TaxID=2528022 RepID=A0A518K967_9BACT|nr:hypothetical protein [Botrimarina mediterranea]QDV74327.1 hypothetical protein Spa11_25290 [Botrimarina mediterranea]QDV78921.1 hypothetical protein K2D_25300 [Planctomycetes bacterium K2D]
MKRPVRYRRRGSTSLVELVVVIFLVTIAFGLVGNGLASLARVDHRFDAIGAESSDLERLAERLRTDVRAAEEARFDSPTLSLTLPNGEGITYTPDAGRWERVADGKSAFFRLPTDVGWSVSSDRLDDDGVLVMNFHGSQLTDGEAKPVFRILLAELNRNARLRIARDSE